MDMFPAIFVSFVLCSLLIILRRRDRRLPPGPFSWPLAGSLFSLRPPIHRYFAKLADKYGPLVYLKAGMLPFVVISSSEMAKQVLKIHDLEFANRPDTTFSRNFSFGYNDLISASHGESWKKLRKISIAHLFTPTKLKQTARVREEQMTAAVKHVRELCDQHGFAEVDLRNLLGEYSSNVISLMLFNSKVALDVVELVDKLAEMALIVNVGEIFPALDWLDLHKVDLRMKQDILPRLRMLLSKTIEQHRQKKVKAGESNKVFVCEDFTDVLISLEESESLTDANIMALLVDMISAGLDTSKASAEWAMAEVVSNPEILQKAQAEVDKVVGRSKLVQESDLVNLPYIQAIFKETLRLHPSVPLGVPHFNPKEATVAGYKIPAKCRVILNIWAIGRDPENWPQPLKFDPERFMETNISVTGQQFELLPFSGGRRMCAGYPLALRSIPLVMATLIQAFDWSPVPGEGICMDEDNGTLSSKLVSGLHAVARPRM